MGFDISSVLNTFTFRYIDTVHKARESVGQGTKFTHIHTYIYRQSHIDQIAYKALVGTVWRYGNICLYVVIL